MLNPYLTAFFRLLGEPLKLKPALDPYSDEWLVLQMMTSSKTSCGWTLVPNLQIRYLFCKDIISSSITPCKYYINREGNNCPMHVNKLPHQGLYYLCIGYSYLYTQFAVYWFGGFKGGSKTLQVCIWRNSTFTPTSIWQLWGIFFPHDWWSQEIKSGWGDLGMRLPNQVGFTSL